MATRKPPSAITSLDRHMGARLRMRRLELGVSQGALGKALGITFQQVQKYEQAKNRISSSRLIKIAEVLKVDVSYFYNAMSKATDGEGQDVYVTFIGKHDGAKFIQVIALMTHAQRTQYLSIGRTLIAKRDD